MFSRVFSSKLFKRSGLLILSVLFLSACDGEVVVAVEDSHSHGHISPYTKIAAVWDSTVVYSNNLVNEFYEVIYEDGRYISYDYRGDSFDYSLNCYLRRTGQLYYLGESLYELVYTNGERVVFEAHVFGDELAMHIVDREGNEHVYYSYAKPLHEHDFYPLCN